MRLMCVIVSGGSTGLVPVAMSDFDNIEVIAQEGLLSGNNSRSAFSEVAGKGKQGFNLTVSDVFAIVWQSLCILTIRRC